uniref:Transmembrane protein n=1 Tax=Haemonchus placei TaxID=6290 RepID=A0A158QL42_HAEPC
LMILHYMENFYYNIVTENLTVYYEFLRRLKPSPETQVSGGGATSQARERRGKQWSRVGNKAGFVKLFFRSEHYQWASNMFVIVNRTSQSALAYTGTLGSQFGSGAVSELGPLNDFKEFRRRTLLSSQYEFATHRLFPMISMKENKIKFAYSNVGGSTLFTRALPRLFYVMTLGGLSVPLEKILVSPMAFPRVSDDSAVWDGSTYKGMIFLDGIDFLVSIFFIFALSFSVIFAFTKNLFCIGLKNFIVSSQKKTNSR